MVLFVDEDGEERVRERIQVVLYTQRRGIFEPLDSTLYSTRRTSPTRVFQQKAQILWEKASCRLDIHGCRDEVRYFVVVCCEPVTLYPVEVLRIRTSLREAKISESQLI
jgi:hypothetical protein